MYQEVLCVVVLVVYIMCFFYFFFFFKQKTAYELRISDWSSDVCSSDLLVTPVKLTVNDKVVEGRYIEEKDRRGRITDSYYLYSLPKQIGRASCRERVCQYV